MTALEARDLSCGYPNATILENVNLRLPTGRFVCLIGANGIGKTTLLRTLAGLLKPVGGEVLLADRPIVDLAPAERARQISVVLTGLPAIGYLSVRQFVEIGRHPYTGTLGRTRPEDHAAVEAAIASVGVSALADRWISTLSDGERQRAAIARAFAQSASLMILDEPTAFLDVESRAGVMTTLRSLAHQSERSVIAASHDIELVLRIADEVWMIEPGGAIATGAPEDLVLAGALDRVFPNHVMEFDLDAGAFRLPRPSGRTVRVEGTGVAARWTIRALERIGMSVSRDSAGTSTDTTIEVGDNGPWRVRSGTRTAEMSSIADVVEDIRTDQHPGRT